MKLNTAVVAQYSYVKTQSHPGRFAILPKCKGCKNCSTLVEDNIMYDTETGKCIICQQPVQDQEVQAFLLAHYGCPNGAFRDKADLAVEGLD